MARWEDEESSAVPKSSERPCSTWPWDRPTNWPAVRTRSDGLVGYARGRRGLQLGARRTRAYAYAHSHGDDDHAARCRAFVRSAGSDEVCRWSTLHHARRLPERELSNGGLSEELLRERGPGWHGDRRRLRWNLSEEVRRRAVHHRCPVQEHHVRPRRKLRAAWLENVWNRSPGYLQSG